MPIKLSHSSFTLADVFEDLKKREAFVFPLTEIQLERMQAPIEFTSGAPLSPYIMVWVYPTFKDLDDNRGIYMAFSNHGPVYFCDGDVLEHYILDEPHFFFDFRIEDEEALIHPDEVIFFRDEESKPWQATFDYEQIFDAFALNGRDGMAMFAGFYVSNDHKSRVLKT